MCCLILINLIITVVACAIDPDNSIVRHDVTVQSTSLVEWYDQPDDGFVIAWA